MRELIRPFIGTVGYVDQAQVKTIESLFSRRPSVRPKFGIFADANTFNGKPSRRLTRNPSKEQLGEIFTGRRGNLNIIHYEAADPARFADEVLSIHSHSDRWLDGIQVNTVWPDVRELTIVRRACYELEQDFVIGMQLSSATVEELKGNRSQLLNRLACYANLVDYIVVDAPEEPDHERRTALLHNLLRDLKTHDELFRFVANVDFNPELPESIQALLQAFPNLSIEASQALCYEDSERLSIETAKRFVNRAINLYDEAQRLTR